MIIFYCNIEICNESYKRKVLFLNEESNELLLIDGDIYHFKTPICLIQLNDYSKDIELFTIGKKKKRVLKKIKVLNYKELIEDVRVAIKYNEIVDYINTQHELAIQEGNNIFNNNIRYLLKNIYGDNLKNEIVLNDNSILDITSNDNILFEKINPNELIQDKLFIKK